MSHRRLGLALALAGLPMATACSAESGSAPEADGPPAGQASGTRVVDLTFDDVVTGERVEESVNMGSALVDLVPVTAGSGQVTAVSGRPGQGTAVGLPEHSASKPPPLAVLAVVPQEADDPLSPGSADFAFGADFVLDEVSEGSAIDDGNNVLQRGLFEDPAQYKMQIDGGRVTCRVAGDAGDSIVGATEPVEAGAWYRASCERSGDTLTFTVTRIDGGTQRSWETVGPTGEVKTAAPDSPLTIGGKVVKGPAVARESSDQFNGRIDNVWVSVTR